MAEMVPILMKDIKLHIQEALKTASKIKLKKTKTEHIIKVLKTKKKYKKQLEKKKHGHYLSNRIDSRLFKRRLWNVILNVLGEGATIFQK